jgi:hypothetical protein
MKAFVLGAALLMAAQAVVLGRTTSSFSIVSPDRPRAWLVGGNNKLDQKATMERPEKRSFSGCDL